MVYPKEIDFVSKRVGNLQFHPVWLVLFDQLWVRLTGMVATILATQLLA